jgi:hypothetical protein
MKMATMQKVVYRFKCISHQHSNVILCRNWKINPKIYMEEWKTLNSKSNPEQNEQHLEVSQYWTSNYSIQP